MQMLPFQWFPTPPVHQDDIHQSFQYWARPGEGGGTEEQGETNVRWTYTGTKNQMFVQAHILVIAHTYTHMHACLHTCTHTHAHTHTHTPLDCSGNAPKLTQQPASSWPSSDWCDTSTGRSSPLKPHWTCKKQLTTYDNCVFGVHVHLTRLDIAKNSSEWITILFVVHAAKVSAVDRHLQSHNPQCVNQLSSAFWIKRRFNTITSREAAE